MIMSGTLSGTWRDDGVVVTRTIVCFGLLSGRNLVGSSDSRWMRRFDACGLKKLGGLGTVVDNDRGRHWVTRIGDHAERREMREIIDNVPQCWL